MKKVKKEKLSVTKAFCSVALTTQCVVRHGRHVLTVLERVECKNPSFSSVVRK